MESLLLDIDHRYVCESIDLGDGVIILFMQAQFYTPQQYQRYNMFNHFFYSPGGSSVCEQFLAKTPSTVAIVMDPPFGGRAEFLAESLQRYREMAGQGRLAGNA